MQATHVGGRKGQLNLGEGVGSAWMAKSMTCKSCNAKRERALKPGRSERWKAVEGGTGRLVGKKACR